MLTATARMDLARRLGLLACDHRGLAAHVEAALKLIFDPTAILPDDAGPVPRMSRERLEAARELLEVAVDCHEPAAGALATLAARVADPALAELDPPPPPTLDEVLRALGKNGKIPAIKAYLDRTRTPARRMGLREAKLAIEAGMTLYEAGVAAGRADAGGHADAGAEDAIAEARRALNILTA